MAKTDSRNRLVGKSAVVTGAGHGIGRAEALLLAREGAKVVVNDLGCDVFGRGADKSIAQRVVDEILGEAGEAVANTDNVATMEGARRIVATAIEAFGRLDILINNAGIVRPGLIDEMAEDDWDSVIDVHLKGSFAAIRHAGPIFREQRSGVIVNTASHAGLGQYCMANYSAAKEGIVGLTRTVARDLGQYNVRCNAIRPIARRTRMGNVSALAENIRISQEFLGIPGVGNYWVPGPAHGDMTPEQVAVLVAWLCTDAANKINGRIFQVMGGEIGLYPEPEVIRAVFAPKGWDLDTLDAPATRRYLIGDLQNTFLPARASQ
jgi:NAD(P)-dependent dehydrogenase (short-subunit alcohol dehydrogenase family)